MLLLLLALALVLVLMDGFKRDKKFPIDSYN
jgi:hypothetical protein